MAVHSFSVNPDGQIGTSEGERVEIFSAEVWAGQKEKTSALDILDSTGYNSLGVPTGLPDETDEHEVEEIMRGRPAGLVVAVPIAKQMSMTFNFQMPRLITRWLANTGKPVPKINTLASPPTISGATKTSGTLSAATGVSVGSLIVIDTSDSTKGGYPELTQVTSINGTDIEFEPLDHAPADSTEVKIVAGFGEGTDKTDTGIYIPKTLSTKLVIVPLKTVEYFPTSKRIVICSYPRFQIQTGNVVNSDNQKTMSFTGKPLLNPAKPFKTSWTDDSETESLPWYGEKLIIGSKN